MGKKRHAGPGKRKVTPPPTPADAESIRLTCRNALNAFHSGNQRDALKMINGAYQKSALVQRTKATILFEAFFQLEDRSLQDFSFKSAVSASQKAMSRSPKSIEFAQFYAFLHYMSPYDDLVYGKVGKECRKALLIEDPIDPTEESVQEEAKTIMMVKDKLKWLVKQLTNAATVKPSMETKITWMAGEMGIDHDQVAETMLLRQQKSGPWVERFEKRSLMYLQCSVERIGQVWNCWKSFSDKSKKEFFRVNLSSIPSHFFREKDKLLRRFLSRAIEFFKSYKKMELWVCYYCGSEFVSYPSMMCHFMEVHLGPFPLKLQEVLPQEVGYSHWVEMIMNGDQWKPESECTSNEDWGLRANILQRIHANLRLLLKHKCLCMSHVYKIIQDTASELQIGMDQTTTLSICSLLPPQLDSIDKLLLQLVLVCDLISLNSKNQDSSMDSQTPSPVIVEETVQDSPTDDSYSASLFLDGSLIGKVIFSRNKAGDDDLIYWLFNGSTGSYTDALKSWEKEREHKEKIGKEVVFSLRNKFVEMKSKNVTKLKHMSYIEGLEDVDRLWVEESQRRDKDLNYAKQSFESLLMKQLKEPGLREEDITLLRRLLNKARKIHRKNSESSEGEKKNDKHPSDKCVSEAILAERKKQNDEIARIDAEVMKILASFREMELKLETLSWVDYRRIVFPLMKIYIRAQVEKKVDEEVVEKAKEAQKLK